jgi:hypothetical protein
MRDLTELGIKPYGTRPYPSFTDASLREFEDAYDVQLPPEYLKFLRFANGGALEVSEFTDPSTGQIGGINDFYGLGNRDNDERAAIDGKFDHGNLWGGTRIFRTQFKHAGVPLARDGGGNRLFLDYRIDPACVTRLILATQQVYQIAPSFEQFLALLRPRTRLPKRNHRVQINFAEE